jgi:hypothetical protein
VREPPEDAVRSFVQHQRLDDDGAEPRHPLCKPRGDATAVQRQVGAAGASSHTPVQYTAFAATASLPCA